MIKEIMIPKLIFDVESIKVGARAVLIDNAKSSFDYDNNQYKHYSTYEGFIANVDEDYLQFVSDDTYIHLHSDKVCPTVRRWFSVDDLSDSNSDRFILKIK